MKALRKAVLVLFVACAALAFTACQKSGQDQTGPKKVKAGFVYVGPVGDYGWSNAHDVARKAVEEKYKDWLTTIYIESVPEGDVMRFIDRLVNEEKCDIIFTTSFGFMDQTVEAAKKYPNTTFMHCSGFKQEKNLGTYFAELYQIYYINGIMAGALSKSGKAGYVGAFPIPEVVRHINAFALGVKVANPAATVSVRWINDWYNPAKAREAAESLVAEGVDALAFTEDTPSVIEVAASHTKAGKQVYAFSHYSPMQQYGEDSSVSGQLVDWSVLYEKILSDFHAGTWTNTDLFWKAKEGSALLGGKRDEPVNLKFVDTLKAVKIKTADLGEINAYELSLKRYDQVKADQFEPFTGPIVAQDGTLKYAEKVVAQLTDLLGITWFVDNVKGDIPSSK